MAVRAQMDDTKQRKLNFEYWNRRQMQPLLTFSYSHLLPLVVTQYLFHASTTSDHAQLRPKNAIILQFCFALAM